MLKSKQIGSVSASVHIFVSACIGMQKLRVAFSSSTQTPENHRVILRGTCLRSTEKKLPPRSFFSRKHPGGSEKPQNESQRTVGKPKHELRRELGFEFFPHRSSEIVRHRSISARAFNRTNVSLRAVSWKKTQNYPHQKSVIWILHHSPRWKLKNG